MGGEVVRGKAEMREERRIRPCRRLPHVRAASAGARSGGGKAGEEGWRRSVGGGGGRVRPSPSREGSGFPP